MARIGRFAGPTVGYTFLPSVVAPSDGNIFPDPSVAAAEQASSDAEVLYDQLRNEKLQARTDVAVIRQPKSK